MFNRRSLSPAIIILTFASAVRLPSLAVLFYETADHSHNVTAPSGALKDSGWQYQGYFGSFLGTMISPSHFITARHIPVSGTFVHDALFSGDTTTAFTVNSAANGGVGYWDIGSTDMRIYEINGGNFTSYAELYTSFAEVGQDLVVIGRGGVRGSAILVDSGSGARVQGFGHTAPDGTTRWGRNTVSEIIQHGSGDLLSADFTADSGQDEAHLSGGDSGGAVFILDGGTWKLAGINFAVDGAYDINDTLGDGSEFSAAMFDQGGIYRQGESGWIYVPDELRDQPGSFYASRVSSVASGIQGIVSVPEPGPVFLMSALALMVRLRRVRHLSTIRAPS